LSRLWEALKQAERERSAAITAEKSDASPNTCDRRGKLRHSHNVALLVYGSDTEKQPFHEETTTIDVNDRGCLIALESAVSHGQRLFLTNTVNQAEQECRVVHVGRRSHGKVSIGVEFAKPCPHFWRPA
jgi:hypothetical protein